MGSCFSKTTFAVKQDQDQENHKDVNNTPNNKKERNCEEGSKSEMKTQDSSILNASSNEQTLDSNDVKITVGDENALLVFSTKMAQKILHAAQLETSHKKG